MAELTHSEDTLQKVYDALATQGIVGVQAVDTVNAILNAGLVIRERA